ncbi:Z-DNA-binding protein 1 isoform X7 [Ranitomeya imitator]|uniref:Z-DNA-binding protein 1 isoform X7 n=1 Tax=Ranitomeya imitator TaxID=111125 RepID=UPI0037E854AB
MAENNETLITAKTRLSKIDCVLTDHHVEGPATNGSMSGTEVASKTIELTDQQKSIITFLTSNEPSKARNIAKGIGKKVAKDVNGDLYKMEKLNLLCLDNKEKLWSINTGLSHTLRGSPNCSLEDSAVNQSHIEIDGGKFSDEPDNRRDSGIDVEGPATNGSIPGTEVASKIFELTEQRSQMTSTPQNVIRNYNINIYGSHLITIGDTTSATQGENTTIYHDYHDTDIAAQEKRNQESAFSHGEQSTDNSLSGPILLHTSEEEGPATAPCTSSLGHSSYHEPNLNIAMICDGLGNMILDDQDNNGDLNQLAFSGEKSTFL